jgi:hypothetical protein
MAISLMLVLLGLLVSMDYHLPLLLLTKCSYLIEAKKSDVLKDKIKVLPTQTSNNSNKINTTNFNYHILVLWI